MAALALCLGGCVHPPPKFQFPTAEDALVRMKQGFACANGVHGIGKIDHRSPDQGRVRGEISIFALNPARVRIDVINPFGAMLFTLTSTSREFQMLDFQQKQLLEGAASACNLARLTKVPVPGHVLVTLLRGEAPLLAHQPEAATLAWDGSDGFYRVRIKGNHDAEQEVRLGVHEDDFDKPWQDQRLRVVGVTTQQEGYVLYDAELRNHEVAHTAKPLEDEMGVDEDVPPSGGPCDIEVPRSIRVEVPSTADDVIFQYKSLDLNPPVEQGYFYQTLPPGTERVRVECDDASR
ncbi:MAG: hypothetical protein IT373_19120 [Polyangiaceae bacterium]|nr:hypothetical protein [Polyangiaceae bacterium]